MILTDREIQIAINKGLIEIKPAPVEKAYSSTSVDLTLDPILTRFNKPNPSISQTINPTHQDYDLEEVLAALTHAEDISSGFPLDRGELVLGWTTEYVQLPIDTRVAARVEGKSSLARLGLCVHLTAPTIHAGFKGRVRLEIVNHGPLPIMLKPGMRICQLIFETTLGTPQVGYSGQFLNQGG